MMKRFFMVLGFSVLACGSIQAVDNGTQNQNRATTPMQTNKPSTIQWMTNYSQALQQAKSQHKPILLFFTGSDWCGWCKKMKQEVFSTPEFAQYQYNQSSPDQTMANAFIFVEVDFPMNKQLPQEVAAQNAALKQKYGITGYPTVIVIDSNENFVAETGYRPGGGKAYAEYLSQFIQ